MKTMLRLLCGWMAIALAACTNHDFEQVEALQRPAGGNVISVKAYTPGEQAATRLAFDEDTDDGSLALSWSNGDAFTAVIGSEKVKFTYNEEKDEFEATLPGGVEAVPDETQAYYPAYEGERFEIDLSAQNGALNSATTYMEGEYSNGAFHFNHLTAILKATFTGLPDGAEISTIRVVGEEVDITISEATIDAEAVYINLPDIAKDTELKFTVTTADNQTYAAIKKVVAERGIEVGIFYNSTIALEEPCLLPTGSDFKTAVSTFLQSNTSLTKIKFVANSDNTDVDNQIGTSGAYMVAGSDNTLEIHTAAPEFLFNADCSSMFNGLNKITSIDFGDAINTANVTKMDYMFFSCKALTSLDLSNFNTANVTTMEYMFASCMALTSIDFGNNFNTANVTNMSEMFYNCKALPSLDLSKFNTANVTDMCSMFSTCSALTSLNLSSFNTSMVTDMASMFGYCYALTSLDLSSFNFSAVTDFLSMFADLGKNAANKPIPVYVTQAALETLENKNTGFNNANAKYVTPGNLPTGSVFNAAIKAIDGFNGATSIVFEANSTETGGTQIGEGSGVYAKVTGTTLKIYTVASEFVFNADCSEMFSYLNKITAIDFGDAINTANVTDMDYMFYNCTALTSLDLSSFNTANVTTMERMFDHCDALPSLDLSSFNTANVTNMSYMFSNNNYVLTSITFGDNFNTSNVTNMCGMFTGCHALPSLDLSSFNTENVTDMSSMFDHCNALTSLDLSSFDTSNVTDMSFMFNWCLVLPELDLSNFDFSKVEDSNFYLMFMHLGWDATNKPIPVYVKDEATITFLAGKQTFIGSNYTEFKVKSN